MTQEEKAKAYDEALERARELSKTTTGANYEYIFPELKESGEERIKNDVKRAISVALDYSYFDKETANNCLAWLEKQGEQKNKINSYKITFKDVLALECAMKTVKITEGGNELYEMLVLLYDKIYNAYLVEEQGEQKTIIDRILTATNYDKMFQNCNVLRFKIDDWIVSEDTGSIYQIKNCIENLSNHKYGYDLTNGEYIGSDDVNHYHLWSIEDAKDGDILVGGDWIFILKQFNSSGNNHKCYCHYDLTLDYFNDDTNSYMASGSNDFKPATKEQRDLLFHKMKEAGYEWDDDKKELKKIEQKSVWSKDRFLSFLKSLKLQNTWKPSDEELKRLKEACDEHYEIDGLDPLYTLYEKLKQL